MIIAGGGTGGHLFPGVAIAEELRGRGHEVSFVGTARGIEARVLPREGFSLDLVDVGGLKGGGLGGLLRGAARLPRALVQSLLLLKRRAPQLVVGVGGYASGPVVMAAWLRGVPTAILEQNSVPGITNRALARVVRAVYASFGESARYFPAAKVELLGNPIRASVRAALQAAGNDAATHHNHAAVQRRGPVLLVLGGSQGAHAVNLLVRGAVEEWAARRAFGPGGAMAGARLVHQSGSADAEALAARYAELGAPVEVRPFIDDMAAAYAASDLIVARAGATTLAEITAIGRPSLLIPFPQAADDHQTGNARALADRGAALLLPQAETTPASLGAAIEALLGDPARRQRMAEAARALGRPGAASAIVDRLVDLAGT